jgi:hypothetical protein
MTAANGTPGSRRVWWWVESDPGERLRELPGDQLPHGWPSEGEGDETVASLPLWRGIMVYAEWCTLRHLTQRSGRRRVPRHNKRDGDVGRPGRNYEKRRVE